MEIAQNNTDPGNISRYERKSEQATEERVKLPDRLNISIGQKAKRLCTSFTSSRFSSPCYARFLIDDPTSPHRVDPFFPSNRENHYFSAIINDRVSSSYPSRSIVGSVERVSRPPLPERSPRGICRVSSNHFLPRESRTRNVRLYFQRYEHLLFRHRLPIRIVRSWLTVQRL